MKQGSYGAILCLGTVQFSDTGHIFVGQTKKSKLQVAKFSYCPMKLRLSATHSMVGSTPTRFRQFLDLRSLGRCLRRARHGARDFGRRLPLHVPKSAQLHALSVVQPPEWL